MSRRGPVPMLPLLLLLAACRDEPPPAPAQLALPAATTEDLLAADRAFGEATKAQGLDGWMSFYARDAVRLTMGAEVVQGLTAVREYDARLFADSTLRLEWVPTDAGLFREGTIGFTTGRSAMVKVSGATRDTVYRGTYVTIWRREETGAWRVMLDTGS